jgi:hypothetical protein
VPIHPQIASELHGIEGITSLEVAQSSTGRVVGLDATDGTVTFADLRYRGSDPPEEYRA